MAHHLQDMSFFEELEMAAKGLSVTCNVEKSTELRQLFNELRDTFSEHEEAQFGSFEEASDQTFCGGDQHA